jgi:hypothetical protein
MAITTYNIKGTDAERIVARYFEHVICPTCSKHGLCWTWAEINVPGGGPQGTSELAKRRICNNICTKAPSPHLIDHRYG